MRRVISFAVLLLFAAECMGKVVLPTVIGDNMVLQRDAEVKLWGRADAGETVTVQYVNKKRYTTQADGEGRWTITLPAVKAGGPYKLQINDITVDNVLFGDVFLCSGQSNMELPVYRVTDMFAEEIAAYENPMIRQIAVPQTVNFKEPQEDIAPAEWKLLDRENVMGFSALAYFFAKELYARNGVPVGLVHSSWGGTPVESWMSDKALEPYPVYLNEKRVYEDDAYREAVKRLEGWNFARWNEALDAADEGLNKEQPWFSAELDDSGWRTVDMFGRDWGNNGLNPTAGSHWLRKSVTIPAEWEGKEATLRLGCVVDADYVYVNGVFVGTTGYMYPPRIYKVPASVLHAGENVVAVRVVSNGGQPSFVKEKPYKIICNGDEVSLEGEWKYRLGAPMPSNFGMTFFHYKPVCLYNAMIAPLAGLAFKGAVWYQGESNVGRRNEYADLLTAMMADWRETFDAPQLPFYIVELADYLPKEDVWGRKAWAEMRAVQAEAAERDGNAVLIRNSDLGEWNDIHPLDKKTLGIRVAEAVAERDARTNTKKK